MKRFLVRYILIFCAVVLVSACRDDLDSRRNGVIREGIPVSISVDLGVTSSPQVSRAAQSDETERTVNRLYLFAFNSDGTLDNGQLFTLNYSDSECMAVEFQMHSGYDKRFYAIANPTSGSGTLDTEELANVETEDELKALTSSLLNSVNIERSYFLMSGQMQAGEGRRIDVTEEGTISGAKECSHSKPLIELERVDARITFKIKGKSEEYDDFKFVPDRYWVENIPQSTYVFPHDEDCHSGGGNNYASMSALNQYKMMEGQDDNDYYYFEFYIPENRLEPKKRITEADKDADGEAESLYALREKQEKTPLTDDEKAESDKNGQTEKNGEFVYANPNSTYVVFHGILSYTDKTSGQQFVYADATYTIHLGNTGKSADQNDPDWVNNYDTERNTHYTYTVTVTGVESMRVEVEENGKPEERPGVEGDVVFSDEAVNEMDAHYGRTQFTLTRGDIKKGLSWAIRTPFQSGMKPFERSNYKQDSDDGPVKTDRGEYTDDEWQSLQPDFGRKLNDYKWVQFLVNKEAESEEDYANHVFAKYPGYAAYVGDDYVDDVVNVPAPPFGGEGTQNSASYDGKVVLYDVNQLLNHLYAEAYNPQSKIFDGNGDDATVKITAFVDEYVYVYDPTKVYYRTPQVVTTSDATNGIDLELWKRVVNGENRMLYISTTGAIYSDDGETSVSRNVFTVAQRPVYTFYNRNDKEVTNGWGTESINETGALGVGTTRTFKDVRENTSDNGLLNTWNVVHPQDGRELLWTDIMTLAERDGNEDGFFSLNEGYNDIWHACIARNRDLNGDNIVQEEEVRWYLASIDQLTDLWVGEPSLNETARLYTSDYKDKTNGIIRSHVASSTYNNNDYADPLKIWAEEGASRGPYIESEDANGKYTLTGQPVPDGGIIYGSPVANGGLIHYRCVRNLGISLNEPNKHFDPYVTVTRGSHTNEEGEVFKERVVAVEKMESNSVRSSVYRDAVLPVHNEREAVNRPYRKFAVLDDKIYDLNGKSQNWKEYQENRTEICPRGYRMPNQRELMLMYMYAYKDEGGDIDGVSGGLSVPIMSGTSFSFVDYYNSERGGFIYNDLNRLILEHGGDNEKGKVRCVRDVVD